MYAFLMLAAAQANDGLTFAEVIAGIPHDAPAFFIYLLTAGAVGWVVWASRKRPKDPGAAA
jgi:hypothetical protein